MNLPELNLSEQRYQKKSSGVASHSFFARYLLDEV